MSASDLTSERAPQPASETRFRAWRSFWRTLLTFQKDKLNLWLAVRSTAGVTLPLIAGALLGSVPAGLAMATGALNVCFSDQAQPYPQRARRMSAASLLVGFAVFMGAICGHNDAVSILVAAAWAFAAGMLVCLSTAAADVGNTSLVVTLVYMAVPQTFERAIYAGLLAIAGGLLQTLLSLAFWPIRPYTYERRALAALYREMARAAESKVEVFQAPPVSAQSTQAQTALATLMSDHSVEAERYRLLLSQAERMRLTVMTLARLGTRLHREKRAEAAAVDRYLEITAGILNILGGSLETGQPAAVDTHGLTELQNVSEALRHSDKDIPAFVAATLRDARFQMDALTGQSRTAIDLATSTSLEGFREFDQREMTRPWTLRLAGPLATLRANLSLESTACRHAIRLAACIALAQGLGRTLQVRRSYWMPMTAAIVLRPDFTTTFSRGVLRVAGTFVGLVVITGIFHALPQGPHVEIALIAAVMFFMRYVGPANYGLFAIAVTALVVLLIAMTGVAPGPVMAARGLNTAIGGFIALVAYGVWPTWERTQVYEAIARMLDAYREYFRAVRLSYENSDASFEELRDRTRMPARLARSNVEASLDRLCAEPGVLPATVKALSGILASSHRMVHAFMALEAGLASSRPVPARVAFGVFANDVELTLYYLAAALRGSPLAPDQLPDLREDHHALMQSGTPAEERHASVNVETDRITNSLNTLTAELLRWMAER